LAQPIFFGDDRGLSSTGMCFWSRPGIAKAEVYVKTAVRKAVDDIQINAEAFDWVPSFIWGKVYLHTLLGLRAHVVIVLQPINGLVSFFFS